MPKRKGKKQQRRPIVIQQAPTLTPPAPPFAAPHEEHRPSPQRTLEASISQGHKRIWRRIPGWILALFSVLSVGGLYGLYPTISINEDYSLDSIFPYNTSFSTTNEGFWPIADLSVTCSADFTMRPWTNDPSDKSSMTLHTQDSDYKDFAKLLRYKGRLTLPCNHNVVANGHRIDPGAKLHILVVYRIWGTKLIRRQTFEFRTVMGWNGQSYWQYQ